MHDIHLHYIERKREAVDSFAWKRGRTAGISSIRSAFFPVAAEYWRWIPEDTEKRKEGQSLLRSGSLRRILPFPERKGIHKADIIGFSDGGNIAIIFAIRFPEKVENLILNGANLYPAGMKLWAVFRSRMEYGLLSLLLRVLWEALAAGLLRLMIKDPYIRPSDLRKIRQETLVIVGTRYDPGPSFPFYGGSDSRSHDICLKRRSFSCRKTTTNL